MNLWNLNYWNSPEWEKVNDRLDYLSSIGHSFSPSRDKMFKSLEGLEVDGVRVVIVGQDPYPNAKYATGRAFDVPATVEPASFPPTLKMLFREYTNDLSLPYPSMGDLSGWVSQGCLLWNVFPSTTASNSLSHDWREYDPLTAEVLGVLDQRGCVFIFLGAVARRFAGTITNPQSRVIEASHPSPRGSLNSKRPFIGSRIFSRANILLREIAEAPIDWRLT